MDSNTVFILNEYRARQAADRRDYLAAIDYSRTAARAASQGNDARGFCRMTFNTGELQLQVGLVEDCIQTCKEILATEAITEFPDYETRARVLMTRALHDKGAMEGALSVAREASNSATQELTSDGRLSVQHVLVAALAEEGDTEGAWSEALALEEMLPAGAGPKVAGMAYWAIGNAAFMSGRIDEGLKYHRLAAEALGSLGDVSVWALFNKATAFMRLSAGLVDAETGECIERAELAFDVAGVTEMDRIEIALTRARWELESGNAEKAETLLLTLEGQTGASVHKFLHARTLLLRARALHAIARPEDALECARRSERILAEVGAEVIAAECREFVDTIRRSIE